MGDAMTDHGAAAVTPVERPTFRPDIQGMRGLAALLIVLFHTDEAISGGYVGVDVFFVVSGFVITGLLVREARATGSLSLRAFFARRARRLMPMLALTLVGTSVLGVVLLSPLGASATTAKTAAAASLINANTFLQRQAEDYFGVAPEANALLHTWSLSVEEQFYLAFPVVVVVGLALRRRLGGLPGPAVLVAVGLAAATSFGLHALMASGRLDAVVRSLGFASGTSVGFYSAPTRAWQFLAGVALALAATRVRRIPPAILGGAGLVGLVLVAFAATTFTPVDGRSASRAAIPVLGAVLLLASGVGRPTWSTSLLGHRSLVWLGDHSYGWYLFHWPLIVFAAANVAGTWPRAVAALAALGLAVAAKRGFEDRFRYDERLGGARVVALGAACVVLPLVAATASLAAVRVLAIDELTTANARHIDSQDCNRRHAPPLPLDADACTWTADDPKGQIVLVGDSHASMWSEATIAAGNALGYDVSIATMAGCPPLAGSVVRMRDGSLDEDCRGFVDWAMEEIGRIRPDLVLLSGATHGLADPVEEEDGRWQLADGTWIDDPTGRAEVIERGLVEFAEPLAEAGVRSAIVHDVPYHGFSNADCSWLRYRWSALGCASVRDRAAVEAELRTSRDAESRAAAAHDLIEAIDPVPWLCTTTTCATYGRGTWLYRDGDHISVAASTLLATELRAHLRELGL